LSKINCTNCEAKIKNNLTKEVTCGLTKVSVNILQEKVNLVVSDKKALQHSIEVLDKLGYKMIGEPIPVKSGNSSNRIVSFLYEITTYS
jgi:copper chaperone CopZ